MIVLLGCAPLAGMLGPRSAIGASESSGRNLYLSANVAADGSYRLAAVRADGAGVFEAPLPGRGHGIAAHPRRMEAAVFARRPGVFAVVLDLRDGSERARLRSPPGRQFFGHGVYSSDGGLLFTTENDFDVGRDVIGVWDAGDGYRHLFEWPSHGIGPHDLALSTDRRTLIVANGGILTHPDTGRRKLNIPTMSPSLAYVDSRDGSLLEGHEIATRRRRLLSTRHLAVNSDDVVCIAIQDQGPKADFMPSVAFHRRGQSGLDLRAAPQSITRLMRAYTGSAAVDSTGRVVAVSAPRGGLVTIWDAARRAFVAAPQLADGCGVAPNGRPNGFLATSGAGSAVCIRLSEGRARLTEVPFALKRHWDNHLTQVLPRSS